MSLAIVPGSFDPMTLGHRALILRAAAEYDRVVVAVMCNAEKEYRFDISTREEIARRTVADLSNVSVISDTGLLVDLFDRLHADAVVKGYRNEIDLKYEQDMAKWNAEHNPRFRTVLLPSEGAFRDLSSTEVRNRMEAGQSLCGFVHPSAIALTECREASVQREDADESI